MGTKHVVMATRDRPLQRQSAFWLEEPAFWANAAHFVGALVQESDNRMDDRLAEYLAHRVARVPGDILCHSQRIQLHVRRGDAEATYGALLDLFISLGDKEPAFREGLLQRASKVLQSEHLAVLQERLQAGIRAEDVVPLSPYSMFSKSLTGTTNVVRQAQTPGQAARDLLAKARDPVGSGRLAPLRRHP